MNLLDFLQSASNAAAGNVSGPVDLVSTLLNKLGVPVQNPVGGSEWMKQKGLMRDVPQSPSSLAGETMGLLAPIGVAAKAPQIASGLLKAQENAAIPRQMNPQMGAIVYHGSPHKFDKFDSSKIGTGEGAQVYGHGLYLAEAPEVAATYRNPGGPRSGTTPITIDGVEAARWGQSASRTKVEARAADAIARTRNPDYAIDYLKQDAGFDKSAAEAIDWITANKAKLSDPGLLYKVDLPDEAIAKMLDWDKPLSQQAPEVKAALEKIDDPMFRAWQKNGAWPHVSGQVLYRHLADGLTQGAHQAGKHVGASQAVRDAGIPGIRYLDGGSRATTGGEVLGTFQKDGKWFSKVRVANRTGVGFNTPTTMITTSAPHESEAAALSWANSKINSGTSNYVIFPGEEHLLKILERNGGLLGP
jgi:hypothetical protein